MIRIEISAEYIALFLSFLFLFLESFIRAITAVLPNPLINYFYGRSRAVFNTLAAKQRTTLGPPSKQKTIAGRIREASDFVEMCRIWGYRAEEYIVKTEDGYLLAIHRVLKAGTKKSDLTGRKVAYFHHGLLMNSEVWVCMTEKKNCLPFRLVEEGYDVWLGNNRGNKYSKKHMFYTSDSRKFWDFSIDQFAIHDIPDTINYILHVTKSRSLSFIGFSQGTAQAFAALSISPTLNEQVDVLICLGPAMSPAGLHNPMVDALICASPNVLFLLFGRKSILSSATFWQSILYPPLFVRIIDYSLGFLFGWRTENITLPQKIAAYSHLYSFTSVKSVVHWFQIIRNQCFQMYDDDLQSLVGLYGRQFYKVARFPTRNIVAPVTLIYGGSDSLVDIGAMLKELPEETVAKEIEHYEHLDFLWAKDVHHLVFPTVLATLHKYSRGKEGELGVPMYSGSNADEAHSLQEQRNTSASTLDDVAIAVTRELGGTRGDRPRLVSSGSEAELLLGSLTNARRVRVDKDAMPEEVEMRSKSRGKMGIMVKSPSTSDKNVGPSGIVLSGGKAVSAVSDASVASGVSAKVEGSKKEGRKGK